MSNERLLQEELSRSVLGGFFEVYNGLGPGYLECLHLAALERELILRGHRVAREIAVRIFYKGHEIGSQRLDMIVEDAIVIEAKSTPELHKNATRQLFSYLRATSLEVGLLLHFGREPHFYRVLYENRLKPHSSNHP